MGRIGIVLALALGFASGCDEGDEPSGVPGSGECSGAKCDDVEESEGDEGEALPFASEHGEKIVAAVAESGSAGVVIVHDLAFCSACASPDTIEILGKQLFGDGAFGYVEGQYLLPPFTFDNENMLGQRETVPRYDVEALERDLGFLLLTEEQQPLAGRMLAEAKARTEVAAYYDGLRTEGFRFYRLSVAHDMGTDPLDGEKLLRERFESLLIEGTYRNYAYLRLELGIDMLKQTHDDIAKYTAFDGSKEDEIMARLRNGLPDAGVPPLAMEGEMVTVPWRPSAPAISVHVCDADNLVWTRDVFSAAYDTGFKTKEMGEFAKTAIELKKATAADCE